ncbi:lysophospholipid acyltransferase family protein [Hyphomonas sp. WL0036]|uniref:lysophospholipid acyltransferase family protein n=1 Tax=Hyphomonas sediminis TaxID=2866160 RepID=UPI001C7EF8C8|nr:lysophospholipid acyltransferase family protein [Hyphomonas sediminis]MBY9066291.1 lysophospholipid acyltransferase family protein [Hyphomonas sediminis]
MDTVAAPELSYAAYFHDPLKRALVRAVERATGQPKLARLYERYRAGELGETGFFDAAIRLLDLTVLFDSARLADLPAEGPLVIVANHPFGVLDGLVISWLVGQRRRDFRVLTNSVLDAVPEARPFLLPVDFAATREAVSANIAMRKAALAHVKAGGCVIVFPAGGVSTTPGPFDPLAVDDDWKPFAAKLITHGRAAVTPIFFEGQNSRLFQIASHLSLELRLALVFREVRRRMGRPLRVGIGETLSPAMLEAAGKRHDLMAYLRGRTYGLAPEGRALRYHEATRRFMARKPRIFR